jgi:hypothetical protein
MNHYKLLDPVPLGGSAGPYLPWRQGSDAFEDLCPMGTMMTEDEIRYLHFLGRELYSGAGAVVDLGPLAGGSTFALASGLAKNLKTSGSGSIHSYDLWEFYEDWQRFFKGKRLSRLQNIEPDFLDNLGDLKRYVTPHRGDICKARWTGAPIEILFIDVAKVPAAMENIVREFYPNLIPHRSILIQQDFISAECPWIHVIQERLSEYFEVVDSPDGGSVCFRPIRRIPANPLGRSFRYESLTIAEADSLLAAAQSRLNGWYRLCVQAARAHFHAMRGNFGVAGELLESIRRSPAFDIAVQYDVDLVSRAIESRSQA